MSTVRETVFEFIVKMSRVAPDKITMDSTLKDLGIDSLDAIQIIFEIEDHYKVTIPNSGLNVRTDSVEAFVTVVERLLVAASGTPAPQASAQN